MDEQMNELSLTWVTRGPTKKPTVVPLSRPTRKPKMQPTLFPSSQQPNLVISLGSFPTFYGVVSPNFHKERCYWKMEHSNTSNTTLVGQHQVAILSLIKYWLKTMPGIKYPPLLCIVTQYQLTELHIHQCVGLVYFVPFIAITPGSQTSTSM